VSEKAGVCPEQKQAYSLAACEKVGPGALNHRTAAPPSVPLRCEILAAGGWLMVTAGPVQVRDEVPTEVDLAAPSFKAAVALTPGDALSITVLTNSGRLR
jgi:hypothetical protein